MRTPADVVAMARAEDACAVVTEWAASGRVGDLVALARLLDDRASVLADHVEDELASCPAALEAALGRAAVSRATTRSMDERVRTIASRLAAAHSPSVFAAAIASHAREHVELFACWLQELVVRGAAIDREPKVVAFRDELAAAGHPLAALPLTLLDVEGEVPSYVPVYGSEAIGRAYEALASGPMSARSIPPPANSREVRASAADVDPRMDTAVRSWAAGPNGKVEAHVFVLEPAVRDYGLGSWLVRALPLASVREAKIECLRVGVEGAFGALFAAAANGGAKVMGAGGAYGRLAAWTSLGALVGAAGPIDEVSRIAQRSAVLSFSAPGPWFHDIAWDLGLLALRPGGASVAVLAATDAE
jgi:hypothetical protein